MTHRFQPGVQYTLDVVCDTELSKRTGLRCDTGVTRLERLDTARCGLLMAASYGVYACDLCRKPTCAQNLIWCSERASGVDLCDRCIVQGLDAGWGPLTSSRPRGKREPGDVYSLAALQRILENRLNTL